VIKNVFIADLTGKYNNNNHNNNNDTKSISTIMPLGGYRGADISVQSVWTVSCFASLLHQNNYRTRRAPEQKPFSSRPTRHSEILVQGLPLSATRILYARTGIISESRNCW